MIKKRHTILILFIGLILLVFSNFLTSAETVFEDSFSQSDSVVAQAGLPSQAYANIVEGSDYTEFGNISEDFFSPQYYFLSESETGFRIFVINYTRNVFLKLELTDLTAYYANNNYEKHDIVQLILDDELRGLSQQQDSGILDQTIDNLSEQEVDAQVSDTLVTIQELHTEFNNVETTKNRKLDIIEELLESSNGQIPSMRKIYLDAAEKVRNDQDVVLFEIE